MFNVVDYHPDIPMEAQYNLSYVINKIILFPTTCFVVHDNQFS